MSLTSPGGTPSRSQDPGGSQLTHDYGQYRSAVRQFRSLPSLGFVPSVQSSVWRCEPRASPAVEAGLPPASIRCEDESVREVPFSQLRLADFAGSVPWRQVRSVHGQAHYSGSYSSVTTGGHVVYESRVELARLLPSGWTLAHKTGELPGRLPVWRAALAEGSSSLCQPLSRIARLSPALCRALRPGRSGVPDALAVMFPVRRSSEDHQGVAGGDAVRGVRAEVGAPVSDPARDPAHRRDRLAPVRGPRVLPGRRLLQPAVPDRLPSSDELPVVERAVAGDSRDRHTAVDTDGGVDRGVLLRRLLPVVHEEGHEPLPALAAQCGRTDLTAEGDPTSGTGPIPAWGASPGPHVRPSRCTVMRFPAGNRNDGGPSWLCAPPDGAHGTPGPDPAVSAGARATALHWSRW
jgi:hypothetical protein